MRVADGDGQCIGHVIGAEFGFRQQYLHHHADLPLFGMTGADHGFLDVVRAIFRDRKPRLRRHQQGDAARGTKFQRGARILVDEGFLDPASFGA